MTTTLGDFSDFLNTVDAFSEYEWRMEVVANAWHIGRWLTMRA